MHLKPTIHVIGRLGNRTNHFEWQKFSKIVIIIILFVADFVNICWMLSVCSMWHLKMCISYMSLGSIIPWLIKVKRIFFHIHRHENFMYVFHLPHFIWNATCQFTFGIRHPFCCSLPFSHYHPAWNNATIFNATYFSSLFFSPLEFLCRRQKRLKF